MSLTALAALGAGGITQIVRANREIPESSLPVRRSPELERILALPYRQDNVPQDILKLVKKPNGKMNLRPIQEQALLEARIQKGLMAPIAVGGGKTLLAVLLPTVLETGPSVILTSAGLVKQARRLTYEYAAHFNIRTDIQWLSYGLLSSPTKFKILEDLKPKVIILDECQAVSNPDAARSKRFERYLKENPDTIVCAMSGTITRRSIKDYAKLLHLCLKDYTPLPRDWKTTQEWAEALDVSDRPRPPGALMELVNDSQISLLIGVRDQRSIARARDYLIGAALRAHRHDSQESTQIQKIAREAVKNRLVGSMGVVASTKNYDEAGLELKLIPTPYCPEIESTLKGVRDKWERPDGELLTFTLEVARVTRHIRQGGFYRWVWPKSVTESDKRSWLDARRDFRSELRDFLRHRSKVGLDSPMLVEHAIRRGEIFFDSYHNWDRQRTEMKAKLGAPQPPSEWVWVSKILMNDVANSERGPRVIWCDTTAVGMHLAREMKLPWYGAGDEAQTKILDEKGTRSIVASIKAHGVGRNLQAFDQARVVGCPSSGATWEQLLGRLHRPGQESETVTYEVYDAFKDEIRSAVRDAEYIFQTTENEQKLLTVGLCK